ncbi:hypothetical protein L3X38_033257 [Prunus dulcis]|uniref:Uncharacterized protein n=1 Tax=Prunus dulcis TaxID=3755 RepID=A0AAD4VH07_PRUDU|nr:hypothetical protein L3X38_033257 [Prunus dulcis]
MSRRSLRTGKGESVTSRLPGQDATSRSRWEMEAASSVCSRLCYCGNVLSKRIHRGRFLILEGGFKYVQGGMDVHFGNGLTQRCVTDRSTSFQACLGK